MRKIHIAVTKAQALEVAKKLQGEAAQMAASEDETEIHIVGIDVYETVPTQHMTPRNYPCGTDKRLPPGWLDRLKKLRRERAMPWPWRCARAFQRFLFDIFGVRRNG